MSISKILWSTFLRVGLLKIEVSVTLALSPFGGFPARVSKVFFALVSKPSMHVLFSSRRGYFLDSGWMKENKDVKLANLAPPDSLNNLKFLI